MKQRIYKLLMVQHRQLLQSVYRSVYDNLQNAPVKTFEDSLTDFYLYLLEAKPRYAEGGVEGYYLRQVRDEKALPAWLKQTFRRFLLAEQDIVSEMREALKEYQREVGETNQSNRNDLKLMHVGFAFAWFNQHETAEDRYLFFRSAYKHFMGFYNWPDNELSDQEVSSLLGLSYNSLRTRTSRLCDKVRCLVGQLSDAHIATLHRRSLELAKEIYAPTERDIEEILEQLMGEAENELPDCCKLVEARRKKRMSQLQLEINQLHPVCDCIPPKNAKLVEPELSCCLDDVAFDCSVISSHEIFAENDVMFDLVKSSVDSTFTLDKQEIADRIVKIFQSFIGW
ncbi:MAG: hypothetical protein Q4D14_05400 [Bacteroidales bacterium]|nr:hypothetical protein [Bacteroidales bacterium]